jgi:integrase
VRKINRLNARAVATITKPGRHADGGNLYLAISESGARSWVFMFRLKGKQTELGFGSARDVTLARARERAVEARAKLAEGIDPRPAPKQPEGTTFGEYADKWIKDNRSEWRSEKHAGQWQMTLGTYAFTIRRLPVADVTTDQVLEVLKPIWGSKPETASRLRGRIEKVLDAAKAQGLRFGENPARWRGHLDHLLPKRSKLARGRHAAMPYENVPGFMADLRSHDGVAARALEFCILTAARTGEVVGMRWPEVDLEKGVWTVPAPRMKGGREHRVPLAARALGIMRMMHDERDGDFVFPGQRPGKPVGPRSLHAVLRGMKVDSATTHGFRSSFRDFAAECTMFSNEVCEAALAHAIANKSEAAYRRGDLFEKRRALMAEWSLFCATPTAGKVVQFKRA